MNIPYTLVVLCLVVVMLLGVFVLVYSLIRLTNKETQSELVIGDKKFSLKGPAWLVSGAIGVFMISAPIVTASLNNSSNVTIPPPPSAVQTVQKISDPSYESFRFIRDVSILDLRSVDSAPWYFHLPGYSLVHKKSRICPGILKSYMILKKIMPIDKIHLVYATSGKLDVRCLTHVADYKKTEQIVDSKLIETWEVIADVSTVPVNQEFEIAVEATYWDGFSGKLGDDYTTYAHTQTEPEVLSVLILFPDNKPFKDIKATEYSSSGGNGHPIQGDVRTTPGPQNQTFYLTTVSQRPNEYYKIAWAW
jgi:hypothetical protein